MRKNTFKKAISLLTASLMAAMCVPAFPVSAAESYAEPAQLITAADEAAAAFTFEASRNVIETGETLAVSIYDTATGDKWHGETLPDFEIGDDSVVSVSAGEETGTFIITGLSTGKTYVRFIGEGDNYADFCITVKQAPTGTTTAAAIISMSFEPSAPTLEVGETITVEMFSRMSDDPYSSNFPVYIISDPSIVSIAPGNDGSSFSLTGLSAGTTRIHFVPFEGTADMTVTVTESGDIMTETTTTTATTTTTIAECYATEVEYDSSPLPVAHVLPVRFYNPETGTATNAQFMEVSDNIDYEYEEGSDTVYIYTLAPGEAKMYILAEGCAFGAYVTFTVTDSGSQSTGTTSTSITTTTTAAYTTTLQQRLAFYFDAPKDTITVGEEMAVKLYSTFKAEYWSESELPEHYVNDPSIAAVEIGEEVGTFKITGLSAGSTFVRFIEEGYADFRITVAEDGTVTTTTTTAPIDGESGKTTYITTAAPALMCSPSAVTVEVGKRQPVILNFASGAAIDTNCEAFESDNAAVAAAEQGEYSYICYVEGITEGTANITITPPYGYDPVTIPVTVVPNDGDDTNDKSAHIVVDRMFSSIIAKGEEINLEFGTYSVFKHDGTSTSMEKVISKVSMAAETENVTIDTSAFDNTAPGYYDVFINYADDEGYTDSITLLAAVYYFDWMDTTTTTATTTTSITSYISTPDCDSTPIETTTTTTAYTSATVHTTTITNLTTPESSTAPIYSTTTLPVIEIVLSDSEIELEAGQRFAIGISKTDGRDYFDGAFVECTSDNPKVAVVQHSDIPYTIYVVGMAEGTANITVYDPVYGSTAMLKVTVTGTADNTIGKDVSIVIDSEPQKLQYNIGEELDLTGGVYRVVMDSTGDNFYGPWDMTAGRIITDAFDNTTAGTYPIYISYNNPIYGYWDVYVFYVTVADQSAGAEKGDINQDGTVSIDDAAIILDYYAKTAAGIDTAAIANTDINGDGAVNISDATCILTYYAKTAAGLPCTWDDIITG